MAETSGAAPNSSATWFGRARESLAGGVSHNERFLDPHPIFVKKAKGSRKWDADGREYVDYSMGSASLLLGHADDDVIAAVKEQIDIGSYYAACHPLEVEWGELIQELMPSVERVRFTASGTESTMLAVRLARAHTGKTKLIRFEGHYHGWHDHLILGMKAPYTKAPSLGIPQALLDAQIVLPPDLGRVEAALKADSDVAGIICEPSGANWGSVPFGRDFLAGLRSLADDHGVALIFDEVITGFRWSTGGAQKRYGIMPDITAMAKIVTGGMPGGATGGREEIMRLVDPAFETAGLRPGVLHRGTFNGNPLVAAAAVATLRRIKTGKPNQQADAIGEKLRTGMQRILDEHQVAGVAYGAASAWHLYFGPKARAGIDKLDASTIRGVAKETVSAWQKGLRERGVDCMSYLGGVASEAHTDADVQKTLDAFEGTLQEMVKKGLVGRA